MAGSPCANCGLPVRSVTVQNGGAIVQFLGCVRCSNRLAIEAQLGDCIRAALEVQDEDERRLQGQPITLEMARAVSLLDEHGRLWPCEFYRGSFAHLPNLDPQDERFHEIDLVQLSTLQGLARRGVVKREPESDLWWLFRPFMPALEGNEWADLTVVARMMLKSAEATP